MRRPVYSPLFFYLFLFILLNRPNILNAQFRTNIFGLAAAANVIVGQADNIKSVLFDKKTIPFDKEGYFIFGFDRDSKGEYILKITFKDKKVETFAYDINPGEYETQAINGLKKSWFSLRGKIKNALQVSPELSPPKRRNYYQGKTRFIKPVLPIRLTALIFPAFSAADVF